MMGELKQIKITNLKSWIVAFLPLKYNFLKTLVGAPINL
jgi:hypothetical protein